MVGVTEDAVTVAVASCLCENMIVCDVSIVGVESRVVPV